MTVKSATENAKKETKGGATPPPSVPIKISPIKITAHEVEAETEAKYLVGITDDAPFHVVYVSGMDFPRMEETVTVSDDGTTSRIPHQGKVISMSDTQLETAKNAIARRYVRKRGSSAIIHDLEEPRFKARQGDIPLGRYLYMIPVGENMPSNWRTATHEPMC